MILLYSILFLAFVVSSIIIVKNIPSVSYDSEACEWVCSLHGGFTNEKQQCPVCYQPINYLEYL